MGISTVRKPSLHTTLLGTSLAACLVAGSSARADVIANPNQLVGTIRFTNTNPAVLAILNDPSEIPPGLSWGLEHVAVTAQSRAPQFPVLTSTTSNGATGRRASPYELTVESGPPGAGIAYDVSVLAYPHNLATVYRFGIVASTPVEHEPAPDVRRDVSECVGVVRVRWVTPRGDPLSIMGGSAYAYPETMPGSGRFSPVDQASDFFIPAGTSVEHLLVRGDGTLYRVQVIWETGTDGSVDLLRWQHVEDLRLDCDEIKEIVLVFDSSQGGSSGIPLPRIVGNIDMLGETELRINSQTYVRADDGPWTNSRWHTLTSVPPSGAFVLPNLMPSDVVTPAQGYRVLGSMYFRRGRRFEYFETPYLDWANGRVLAPLGTSPAGNTVDLGDTFVVNPGRVEGTIVLAGPPATDPAIGSCLEDLYRVSDDDADRDGIPDNPQIAYGSRGSSVVGRGLNLFATGATKTALGGAAYALFEGDFAPGSSAFLGDYELVAGGLNREPSKWELEYLRLHLLDDRTPEVPESYQEARIQVEVSSSPLLIVPGGVVEYPLHYCLSQVNLAIRSPLRLFFQPEVRGSGGFAAFDFEGRFQVYNVNLERVYGTPLWGSPAEAGLVVMGLPQGDYGLTPVINTPNASGGTSETELSQIQLVAGCRQIIEVSTDLQLAVDNIPYCAPGPTQRITGAVTGTASIDRLSYSLNGGGEVTVCTSCGISPPFAVDVPLQDCDNRIRVTAVDTAANTASVTVFSRRDGTPPTLSGCTDLTVPLDPGGTIVTYAVTASDGCDAAPHVTCTPASGSTLPEGTTPVNCTATDSCGNHTACTFHVTVVRRPRPLADAGPNRSFCPGAGTAIGGAPTGWDGTPPYTYQWSPALGLSDPLASNPTATPTGPVTYTVTVIDQFLIAASDSATLSPIPDPAAAFTHPPEVCLGCTQVPFTDQSTGNPVAWSWAFGDGDVSIARNPTHVYRAPGSYVVTLTVTNACGRTSTATSTVVVAGLPRADFAANAPRCAGLGVAFTNQSTPDATSFAWDFGDGSPLSTLRDPVHPYATPGVYVVTLTASSACGTSTPLAHNVAVVGPPEPSFTSDSPRCSGPIHFADSSTGAPTGWWWDFGDGSPLDPTQNPIHTYTQPGTYTVTLVVTSPCGSSAPYRRDVIADPTLGGSFARWTTCTTPRVVGTAPSPPYSPENTTAATTASTSWEFDDGTYCRSSACTFAMYAVADCGTAMKFPLYDNETGHLRVHDLLQDRVQTITATGGNASCPWEQRDQPEVQWQDCSGTDCHWNDETTTVSFQGTPAVCGVYRLEFIDWGGKWWDLFANCDGSNTPGFTIYDNACDALAAYTPLPEIAMADVHVTGVCPSYSVSVEVRNTGCVAADVPVRVTSSQGGSVDVLVRGVEPGVPKHATVDLAVLSCVAGSVSATADPDNTVVECSESQGASVSCNAGGGGSDVVSATLAQPCQNPPLFCGVVDAFDLDPCADTGVKIVWPQAASPGSGGSVTYSVYRDDVLLVAGLTTTEHVDTTGVNGTEYRYRVQAVNGCGLLDITFAEVRAADAIGAAAPGGVGNRLFALRWFEDVRLVWTRVPGSAASEVLRDEVKDFSSPSPVGSVTTPLEVLHDRGAVLPSPATLLFYRVRALSCNGTPGP